MSSGAFMSTLRGLAPQIEKATGDHIRIVAGPSMGATPEAIPNRLMRHETADVVILARAALDDLAAKKLVDPDSRTDLVRSRIAMAVKAGAPKPDISTLDAFKKTLLKAKSAAWSDSASGVYLSTQLFKRMGIEAEMTAKGRMIPARPVGEVVASGQYEIGFQQFSELKPVPGITIVGPLPEGAQQITIFSAGVASSSKQPKKAQALIAYLTSRAAAPAIRKAGLDPAKAP
jgi:molybdate transport system substrate-binding protein